MSDARAPIIVLAAPFSHGSELCAMLGQHPALLGLPSLHLFSRPTLGELLAWFDEHPRLAEGLLRTVAHVLHGRQTPEAIASARAWLDARKRYKPADVLGAIDELSSGRRLVEWSFSTAQPRALAQLAEACPQARFIHLLRDPSTHRRAVMADRRRRGLDLPNEPDRFWLIPNLAIFEFMQVLPWRRHIRMQSEMLVTAPRETLRQILEWLDLPHNPTSLEAMCKPEESPFAEPWLRSADLTGHSRANGVGSGSGFLQPPPQRDHNDAEIVAGPISDAARLFATRWNYCLTVSV